MLSCIAFNVEEIDACGEAIHIQSLAEAAICVGVLLLQHDLAHDRHKGYVEVLDLGEFRGDDHAVLCGIGEYIHLHIARIGDADEVDDDGIAGRGAAAIIGYGERHDVGAVGGISVAGIHLRTDVAIAEEPVVGDRTRAFRTVGEIGRHHVHIGTKGSIHSDNEGCNRDRIAAHAATIHHGKRIAAAAGDPGRRTGVAGGPEVAVKNARRGEHDGIAFAGGRKPPVANFSD